MFWDCFWGHFFSLICSSWQARFWFNSAHLYVRRIYALVAYRFEHHVYLHDRRPRQHKICGRQACIFPACTSMWLLKKSLESLKIGPAMAWATRLAPPALHHVLLRSTTAVYFVEILYQYSVQLLGGESINCQSIHKLETLTLLYKA